MIVSLLVLFASFCYLHRTQSAVVYPPFYPGQYFTNNFANPYPNVLQNNYMRHFPQNGFTNRNEPLNAVRNNYWTPNSLTNRNRNTDDFRIEKEIPTPLRVRNGPPSGLTNQNRNTDNFRNALWVINGFANEPPNSLRQHSRDRDDFRNRNAQPNEGRNINREANVNKPPNNLRNRNRNRNRNTPSNDFRDRRNDDFRNEYRPPPNRFSERNRDRHLNDFRNENKPSNTLRNRNRDDFRNGNVPLNNLRERNIDGFRNENRAPHNRFRETNSYRDLNIVRNENEFRSYERDTYGFRIGNEPPNDLRERYNDGFRSENRPILNDFRETNRDRELGRNDDTNRFRISHETPNHFRDRHFDGIRNDNRARSNRFRETNTDKDLNYFRNENEPQTDFRNRIRDMDGFRNDIEPENGLRNIGRDQNNVRNGNKPPIVLRESNIDTDELRRRPSPNGPKESNRDSNSIGNGNGSPNGIRIRNEFFEKTGESNNANRESDVSKNGNTETVGNRNENKETNRDGDVDGDDFENGNIQINLNGLLNNGNAINDNKFPSADVFLKANINEEENSQQISNENRQSELVNEFNGILPNSNEKQSETNGIGNVNGNAKENGMNGMMAVMPMRAQVMFMRDENGIDVDGDGVEDQGGFNPRVVMMPFFEEEEEVGMFDEYGGPMTAIGMFGLPALIVIDTIFNFLNSGPNEDNQNFDQNDQNFDQNDQNFDPVDQNPSNFFNFL